jgi:hypothetical protein
VLYLRHKLIRISLSAALVVGLVFVFTGNTSAQTTEPDNDDDAYDQETCAGVPEDDVADTNPFAVNNPFGMEQQNGSTGRNMGNDPDEFSPFPNSGISQGENDLPFEMDLNGLNFSFAPSFTQDERALANDAAIPEPETIFQNATPTAEPGQEVVVALAPGGFTKEASPGMGYYYASFVDGLFLNGRLASGSDESMQGLSLSAADASRPDCGVFVRTTQSDADGDGMDDSWELRYGLNPGSAADAGRDDDDDGYVANDFINADGQPVNPAPAIAGGELGDGILTNAEEYTLGTDPTVADTDGDGFSDEADAVGLGQHTVTFTATKDISEGPYLLHVIVVGSTEKRNEDEHRLIKIDSESTEIQQRVSEDLEVQLGVVTPVVRPGDTLEVEAAISGSATHDLLQTYNWTVNEESLTAESGQGKRTLRYVIPEETTPGTELRIEVAVINPDSGQLRRGRTTLVLGDTILMNVDPESVERNALVTVNALLAGGADPNDFLYEWRLDRTLVPEASKVGAASFTFAVNKSGGDKHQVEVIVYRVEDSSLFGTATQQLLVQSPQVTLSITPESPVAGESIVARAQAEHFSSESLTYTFTVDGVTQESVGPLLTIAAGNEHSQHEVGVQVTTTVSPIESARAEIRFTTGAGALSFSGTTADSVLASLRDASRGLGAGLLAVVLVAGSAIAVVYRVKMRPA